MTGLCGCIFQNGGSSWVIRKPVKLTTHQVLMNNVLSQKLKQLLNTQTDIELAILIGSQVTGKATADSDVDIAIRWQKHISPKQQLGKTETLRRLIANKLNFIESEIDLVNLTSANLAMKAVVAEEGIIIKGEDSLEWNHFLQRTWRDLETFYWTKIYAT